MTIEQLGSVGEFVAAIATLATLVYLAMQVRQNTKALRATTFQQVSEAMAQNVSHVTDSAELAEIMLKVGSGEVLDPVDRVRYQGLMLMSMRRLESVYLHHRLGYMDSEQVKGFELSLVSLLSVPVALTWWGNAKATFHQQFVEHVDQRLKDGDLLSVHPSVNTQD